VQHTMPCSWVGFNSMPLKPQRQCHVCCLQVFEGRVVDGDNRSGGHVITATAGSGANKQTFNYATERVVGNGSFGTVFQATCLETAETVSSLACCGGRLHCSSSSTLQQP
jgi:hypothetical protein